MLSKRKKRPVQRTRLRFARCESPRAPRPFDVAPRQTFETMDLSEYDEDLIEAKRRAEAEGVYIWIPKRDAMIELPEPFDFGESLSDIVIRNRGREP
jgi:hypothetical protein